MLYKNTLIYALLLLLLACALTACGPREMDVDVKGQVIVGGGVGGGLKK